MRTFLRWRADYFAAGAERDISHADVRVPGAAGVSPMRESRDGRGPVNPKPMGEVVRSAYGGNQPYRTNEEDGPPAGYSRLLDNAHCLRDQRVVFFADFEDSEAKGGAPGRTPFGER